MLKEKNYVFSRLNQLLDLLVIGAAFFLALWTRNHIIAPNFLPELPVITFGNHHMLKAATSTAGEIVALCGAVLNPYKEGKLGVVKPKAYADLLLVDGNPLEDITVIGAVDKWFDAPERDGVPTIRIIMKNGKIFKNTLGQQIKQALYTPPTPEEQLIAKRQQLAALAATLSGSCCSVHTGKRR